MTTLTILIGAGLMYLVWRSLRWDIVVVQADDAVPMTTERRAMLIDTDNRQRLDRCADFFDRR